MDIEEAYELKRAAENQITKLIREFSDATGLEVRDFDLLRTESYDACGRVDCVDYDVRLEVGMKG